MSEYSSFKKQQLLTENWRRFITEEEERKKIFVLEGPPSVGKSHWIGETFQEEPYIINRE